MSDDFFELSERQGQLYAGLRGLGDDRETMVRLFSAYHEARRRSLLEDLDRRLSGDFEFVETRKAANLHSLRRELERRHALLMRLGK
jgi:hypothetical protein